METQILTWLLNQGGGYVLVAGLFYFYRRDVKNGVILWKEQRDIMLKALLADTEMKARLTTTTEQLAELVEHCEIRRVNASIADDERRAGRK